MTFAKEIRPFFAPFIVATMAFSWFGRPWISLAFAITAILILLFFRIPARDSKAADNILLAPANGKITKVETLVDPEIGPGRYHHIVTFLSVFNIHVQRSPVAGEVVRTRLRPGRKVAAFREDAGEVNESHLSVIQRPNGELIGVEQLAGLVARRVVSYLDEGQELARGELIGVIKFGSRVDLYVPAHYRILVSVGDTVHEGETPMVVDDSKEAT